MSTLIALTLVCLVPGFEAADEQYWSFPMSQAERELVVESLELDDPIHEGAGLVEVLELDVEAALESDEPNPEWVGFCRNRGIAHPDLIAWVESPELE